MAKLTPEQIEFAKSWFHDVGYWGGLIAQPVRTLQTSDYYPCTYSRNDNVGKTAAKVICDAIKTRPVNYQEMVKIDSALDVLSIYRFARSIKTTNSYDNVWKKPKILAKYLAFMTSGALGPKTECVWDDSNASTYEIEEIKKTMIGSQLFEFRCFKSQKKSQSTQTASATSTVSSTPRQPGQAPQNNYKSSGPQSGNMKCIIGTPGQKLVAASAISYCIEADKIGKNTPNAFIKPLNDKACPNSVATVFMGSGNFYTDCKCWLDDINDATLFLFKVQAKFGNQFTNIHISKAKSDANGYYIAQTQFGNCGIKASKLNEELNEELTEEVKENRYNGITDIDTFDEAFFKYE